MNPREKALSGAIAFLLIVWGGWTLWGSVASAYDTRESQLRSLQREYKDAKRIRTASRQAAAQLDRWQTMSLPADDREARKVYLQWLRHELDEASFENVDIKPSGHGRRNSAYRQLRFIVTLNGTLTVHVGTLLTLSRFTIVILPLVCEVTTSLSEKIFHIR